jgi:hypothetical protein
MQDLEIVFRLLSEQEEIIPSVSHSQCLVRSATGEKSIHFQHHIHTNTLEFTDPFTVAMGVIVMSFFEIFWRDEDCWFERFSRRPEKRRGGRGEVGGGEEGWGRGGIGQGRAGHREAEKRTVWDLLFGLGVPSWLNFEELFRFIASGGVISNRNGS